MPRERAEGGAGGGAWACERRGTFCTFETAPWRGWSLAETLWEENLGRGGLALRAELRARDWFWSARVWLST